MSERILVARALADLLNVLSHPHRIRIVEAVREREMDVNALQELLGISHSGVSQHLALLRAHRIVVERREGRHVYYHLRQPQLAAWLTDALRFLEPDPDESAHLRSAVSHVRALWSESASEEAEKNAAQ